MLATSIGVHDDQPAVAGGPLPRRYALQRSRRRSLG